MPEERYNLPLWPTIIGIAALVWLAYSALALVVERLTEVRW